MNWVSLRARYENWKWLRQSRSLSQSLPLLTFRQWYQELSQQRQSMPLYANRSRLGSNPKVLKMYFVVQVAPGGTITFGNRTIFTNLTTSWMEVTVDSGGQVINQTISPGPTGSVDMPSRLPDKVTHPLLGFRAFYIRLAGREWDVMGRLQAKDVRLSAINMQFGDWHPGANTAVHWADQPYGLASLAAQPGHHPHVVPASNCSCGFWSLFDLADAWRKVRWPNSAELNRGEFTHIPALGVIQGWGRVRQHEDGYRFEHASVVALALKGPEPHITGVAWDFAEQTARTITRRFDVPYYEDWGELNDFYADERKRLTNAKEYG